VHTKIVTSSCVLNSLDVAVGAIVVMLVAGGAGTTVAVAANVVAMVAGTPAAVAAAAGTAVAAATATAAAAAAADAADAADAVNAAALDDGAFCSASSRATWQTLISSPWLISLCYLTAPPCCFFGFFVSEVADVALGVRIHSVHR
jgi:hypothetical protein